MCLHKKTFTWGQGTRAMGFVWRPEDKVLSLHHVAPAMEVGSWVSLVSALSAKPSSHWPEKPSKDTSYFSAEETRRLLELQVLMMSPFLVSTPLPRAALLCLGSASVCFWLFSCWRKGLHVNISHTQGSSQRREELPSYWKPRCPRIYSDWMGSGYAPPSLNPAMWLWKNPPVGWV